MEKVKYHEVMWAEMNPDIYSGPDCDQVKPRWRVSAEGDMGSGDEDMVEMLAEHFPPGTKISVSVPVCPKCGVQVEGCRHDEHCDFDWDAWTEETYQ